MPLPRCTKECYFVLGILQRCSNVSLHRATCKVGYSNTYISLVPRSISEGMHSVIEAYALPTDQFKPHDHVI
jgi:hypothetical protein